jgi:hypothetical protein
VKNEHNWRLLFTSWHWALAKLQEMILCTPIWCKITRSVWEPRVHKLELPYKFKILLPTCKQNNNVKKSPYNTPIPWGGCGNLSPYLSWASLKTLISWTEPGHPTTTNVNLISKSHMAKTFWVVYPCLLVCWTTWLVGTTTDMCVPSMAPMQLSKYGENLGAYNLLRTVLN